mmetsp:Transcript_22872/g.91531  ORF Transcript_22872/g.91531 Transcript_22872/m.91531 type:complete len:209 (-) Transcript_22872:303-929(-)
MGLCSTCAARGSVLLCRVVARNIFVAFSDNSIGTRYTAMAECIQQLQYTPARVVVLPLGSYLKGSGFRVDLHGHDSIQTGRVLGTIDFLRRSGGVCFLPNILRTDDLGPRFFLPIVCSCEMSHNGDTPNLGAAQPNPRSQSDLHHTPGILSSLGDAWGRFRLQRRKIPVPNAERTPRRTHVLLFDGGNETVLPRTRFCFSSDLTAELS